MWFASGPASLAIVGRRRLQQLLIAACIFHSPLDPPFFNTVTSFILTGGAAAAAVGQSGFPRVRCCSGFKWLRVVAWLLRLWTGCHGRENQV